VWAPLPWQRIMYANDRSNGTMSIRGRHHGATAMPGGFPAVDSPLSLKRGSLASGRSRDADLSTCKPLRASRIEKMAAMSERCSSGRSALLGVLIASASPTACGGCQVLRPIWANEAMQRAYTMMRLVALLEERVPARHTSPFWVEHEQRLGTALGGLFSALRIRHDDESLACSQEIRDIARGLVSLFGPAAGDIGLRTNIGRIDLPAFQRRALVLMTANIIMDSLLNGFERLTTGQITVQLSCHDAPSIRLRIIEHGGRRDVATLVPPSRCDSVHDLASLLQASVAYRRFDASAVAMEFEFSI
jgi:hypothetical protein